LFENKKIQIRISKELLDYVRKQTDNISLFIREALREKIESGLINAYELVEIRVRTPYTYFAKLLRVIDSDTLLLQADLGFFIKIDVKVRLLGIDTQPIDTELGQKAAEFLQCELEQSNLLIEVHKKEKYGRYLAYIYYSKEYKDFEDIIRYGKLINEELIKQGLANIYKVNS
jgi:micrococcal nuclease